MMLKRAPEQRPSVQNLLDSERVPIVEIEESHFQVTHFLLRLD